MEEFQALPTEEELGEWLEKEAFKDDIGALNQVLEGFKALTTFTRTKRMMMTMSNDAQLQTLLTVMKKDGERGRLWPGLGQEVRVESMTRRSMEIIVLDVDPESDENLVRLAMEKYGEVKRCERMRMSGIFHRVVVNKVKVELVRNEKKLPNIIHAFGTTTSADDFATWKMEYRGCPRYCYGCGATSHKATQWFRLIPSTRFGPILRKKSSDGRHFFLVRATTKTKIVLIHKLPNNDYRRCTRGLI